ERVLTGYGVVTICYRNHRGQSVAETFEFNESCKVKRAYACYS
ncbi:MAG: nuclear transport factor 2 family protein, partial [Oxalobacteraceae bacterium]|nr:nuclear transport factor 2 family protein [Oxalobacteraceae bacterium]